MTDNIGLITATAQQTSLESLLHWAVDDTVSYLRVGQFDRALQRITTSVLGEQARVAGIRVMPDEVCTHGFWRSTCGEAHR